MMNLKIFKNRLLSIFFTKRCKFCLDVCDIRDDTCEKCKNELPKISDSICYKCGCEKKNCQCTNRGSFTFYQSVCAPYYYEGPSKKAVRLFKFGKKQFMAEAIGDQMCDCVKDRYDGYDFDFVSFVPSHIDDENDRGFNQSELLAKRISENLNIPFKPLLQKDFKTPPQHSLPLIRRSGNLLGAISCKKEENIEGTRVLLCDDIKTSGETLNECSKTLLLGGATEVRCVTFCITKRDKKK